MTFSWPSALAAVISALMPPAAVAEFADASAELDDDVDPHPAAAAISRDAMP